MSPKIFEKWDCCRPSKLKNASNQYWRYKKGRNAPNNNLGLSTRMQSEICRHRDLLFAIYWKKIGYVSIQDIVCGSNYFLLTSLSARSELNISAREWETAQNIFFQFFSPISAYFTTMEQSRSIMLVSCGQRNQKHVGRANKKWEFIVCCVMHKANVIGLCLFLDSSIDSTIQINTALLRARSSRATARISNFSAGWCSCAQFHNSKPVLNMKART